MTQVSRYGRIFASLPPVTPSMVSRLALASVIANVGIVVTGGAVRLTGSGLGCPTWPTCTDAAYTPNQAMGIHGAIEFSNRMLTFAVGAIAALALLAVLLQRPRRRSLVILAALVLAVIPAQAVVGGLTVLTDLNPWVVACHFLVSIAIIAAAYAFWRRSREPSAPTISLALPAPLRVLGWLLIATSAAVLAIGTIVTGSGPHAGDVHARRTGLDPRNITQLHTDAVFLLVGLSVAMWFALRAASAPRPAVRAAAILVAVELGQGVIGFVQYFTHLPELLVGLHMLGACLVWLATLDTLHHTRYSVDLPVIGAQDDSSTTRPAPRSTISM
jgi:cytochrome c oxidase assembly protein subunit 15